MTYPNGDKYEGELSNGKKNGKGNSAPISQDANTTTMVMCMRGSGRTIRETGTVAEEVTLGTCSYADGDKYEGEWKDDKRDGEGTMSYKNGDKFTGEWKEGRIGDKGKAAKNL